MELQMRAERERRAAVTNAEAGKRAAILEAEGMRESQVRKAEGEKEAAILRAEGQATARLAMAQAEAEAIQRITNSLPEGQAAMYLLGLKYLEALPAVTQGRGTTIFLPAEASGVMGALGGMRELLKSTAGQGPPVGGANQPAYTPPPPRPAFKSLSDSTSDTSIAGSDISGYSDGGSGR
jgi:regulator of protease activity HflC (stomatin/prohibitin superfamily)